MQAGVDEVGRGCLAGPVVAAAVVLFNEVEGLKDSKQLTPIKRNRLCDEILENGIAGIGISSNVEVDEINIHQASLLAMERAISNLEIKPSNIFVDGKFGLNIDIPNHPIIGGDKKCFLISAEIKKHFLSPPIIGWLGISMFNPNFPSTKILLGFISRLLIALSIAKRDA